MTRNRTGIGLVLAGAAVVGLLDGGCSGYRLRDHQGQGKYFESDSDHAVCTLSDPSNFEVVRNLRGYIDLMDEKGQLHGQRSNENERQIGRLVTQEQALLLYLRERVRTLEGIINPAYSGSQTPSTPEQEAQRLVDTLRTVTDIPQGTDPILQPRFSAVREQEAQLKLLRTDIGSLLGRQDALVAGLKTYGNDIQQRLGQYLTDTSTEWKVWTDKNEELQREIDQLRNPTQ